MVKTHTQIANFDKDKHTYAEKRTHTRHIDICLILCFGMDKGTYSQKTNFEKENTRTHTDKIKHTRHIHFGKDKDTHAHI